MEFSYTTAAPSINATFAVIWGGSKPLDNPGNIHVLVYKCQHMASNCGMCLNLAERFRCGWCQSSSRCEVAAQCEEGAWLDRDRICPNQVLTATSSAAGAGDAEGPNSRFIVDRFEDDRWQEFTHLTVDKNTGTVYAGGVNRLYQLEPNLRLLQYVVTGPVSDSVECPASGCFSEDLQSMKPTNNVNKVLVIDYTHSRLIVCGSVRQGSCQVRDLRDITQLTRNVSKAIVANNATASTVAFIAPGPPNSPVTHVLYVGVTYTGRSVYRDEVPAVSSRSLEDNRFLEIAVTDVTTSTQMWVNSLTRKRYPITYVYGFGSENFSYFLTRQMEDTCAGSPYMSKLVRVCQNDPAYYSYTEIPIECKDQQGKHYNLVQAAYVGKPGTDLATQLGIQTNEDVLFAVFSPFDPREGEGSPQPTDSSALCLYSMKSVRRMFTNNIQECFRGIGVRGLNFISPSHHCIERRLDLNEDFCGMDVNTPLGGKQPVESLASLTFPTRLTAVAATSTDAYTVVFLGTAQGHLKKVVIENQNNALEYDDIEVDQGSAVRQDMHFDKAGDHLYVMTSNKISKVKTKECSIYEGCSQCLGARDPYCGWCSSENKCSLRRDCREAFQDPRFWLNYKTDRCAITRVKPDKIQRTTTRTLALIIENMLPVDGPLQCVFSSMGKDLSTETRRTAEGVSCPTPRPDLLPVIPQNKNHFTAKLCVRKLDGVELVCTNFTFFDCTTYSSCTECVSSPFPCDWCVDGHRCTHDSAENCRNDVLVNGVNRFGPSIRSGPSFCPRITFLESQEILVSSGSQKSIKVKVDNIAQFIVQTRFVCQFNIEGRVTGVNANLLGDTIYCDRMEFSYTTAAPSINATFAVIWGGSKPLDNPGNIHVLVYKCQHMASNCGMCLNLAERFRCGWCQSSSRCEVAAQCEEGAWLDRDRICPNQVLTATSSAAGGGDAEGPNSRFIVDRFEDDRWQEFTHLTVDKNTGTVYAGGVNRLYQLDPNLRLLQYVVTGPVSDSVECPASGCFSEDLQSMKPTNNVNKVLIVDYTHSRLIVCGSVRQGSCQVRDLRDITQLTRNVSEGIVANNATASTVAFIAPGPPNPRVTHVLYVGVTYTGRSVYRDEVPAVSSRSLEDNRFLEIAVTDVTTSTQMWVNSLARKRYPITYVYGFGSENFSYFLTRQMEDTYAGSPYMSKLVRVCQNDPAYYSYTEIPIECKDQQGKHYNLVQAAYVGKPGTDLATQLGIQTNEDVLFAVFSPFDPREGEGSPQPTDSSALCLYSMKSVRHMFMNNIQECFRGIGVRGLNFISPSHHCIERRLDLNEDFCGMDVNTPLGGKQPVESLASLTFPTRLTAVAATSTDAYTVVFLGTAQGHLKKVVIENRNNALEYDDIEVDQGSAVRQDMHFDKAGDHLYVMTSNKISKVKTKECSIYEGCSQCLGARDPYCGWCSSENKCSLRRDCREAFQDPRFWLNYKTDRCAITRVKPDKIQRTTTRTLALMIENMLPVDGPLQCVFSSMGKDLSTETRRTAEGVSCPTPRPDLLPVIPQNKNHFTAKLCVRKLDGVELVCTNFTFFDCTTYSSCTECVSSPFPCDWCVDGHRCTHDSAENCRNDVLVNGVNRFGPSIRSGPSFCPRITFLESQEILVSSGSQKSIKVKVDNIAQFIVQTRFVCQFNIEGRVTGVNANLLSDTIYCDRMEFSYTTAAPSISATFAVIWGGSKPLDNPGNIHVLVYKCQHMASNCGMCLNLAERFRCGWCQSSSRCEVAAQCEEGAWLDRDRICPNVLTATSSAAGGGDAEGPNSRFIVDRFEDDRWQEFTHLTVDKNTGTVYAGGVNRLYQLEPNLRLLQYVVTGPVSDSVECPASGCFSEDLQSMKPTNNVNKVLIVDYTHSRLIVCGSVRQGSCQVRDLWDITQLTRNVSEAIVANNATASTVAFIAPGPPNPRVTHVLYVGVTYTGRSVYRDEVPAVSSRSLEDNRFLEIAVTDVTTSTQMWVNSLSRKRYPITYVYGFGSENFSYFLTRQMEDTYAGSPYMSKLVRVCQNDPAYYSYTEIPIECKDQQGKHYNLVQAAYVGKPGTDLATQLGIQTNEDVLFAVFSPFDPREGEGSPQPTDSSALCLYSMKSVRRMFMNNIQECFRGIGVRGLNFISPSHHCIERRLDLNEDFCGMDVNTPLGGKQPVESLASLTFPTRLTAVAATSTDAYTVVFLGTAQGHLKKVVIENQNNALEYDDIEVDQGSAVRQDMHFDKAGDHLYVMTSNKISKVKTKECSIYEGCSQCLGARDPYCGWCSSENKCSLRRDCREAFQDPRSWLNDKTGRCATHRRRDRASVFPL
ncbi:uncharacterized protein [Penaeus vannamei]|uniref:uncharacterized protein isoform X3 n=1 Tax=Penaeus vannamei TaxID=6689 RepID=UPI00387F544F